jgi:uncharacterized protein YjbJ (UPF0337 family)
MADESGSEAGLQGVTEDIKRKAKEAVGAVTDNESLKGEGQAQQDKADAEREVAAREADAEKARGQAAAAEAEERAISSRSSDRRIVFGGRAEAR